MSDFEFGSHWYPFWVVIVEDPDGNTYEQPFEDIHDLDMLYENLGSDYSLVSIY